MGEELPRVWHAETTTLAARKHLLRLVVTAVRVDQTRQPGQVCCEITGQSGAHTVHELDRLGVRDQDINGSARLQHRLHQLHAQRQSDAQVAQAVGVSKSTVHRWVKQGRLKGDYLGSRTLWRIHRTTRQIHRLRKEVSATPSPSMAETITVN
jgi:excisionase family DNA binding protein